MHVGYSPQQSSLGSLCCPAPPWSATAVAVTALISMPSTKAVYMGSLELFSKVSLWLKRLSAVAF